MLVIGIQSYCFFVICHCLCILFVLHAGRGQPVIGIPGTGRHGYIDCKNKDGGMVILLIELPVQSFKHLTEKAFPRDEAYMATLGLNSLSPREIARSAPEDVEVQYIEPA